MLQAAIWLIFSAPSIEAPELPPWPAGLPDPVTMDCGVCLPPPLADAVEYRLASCDVLPSRCETRLAALREALESECGSKLDLAKLDAPGPAQSLWRDALLVGAGVVAGLLLGAVVGG